MTMEEAVQLGSCPKGQLEGRHIENMHIEYIGENTFKEFGHVVGYKKGQPFMSMSLVGSDDTVIPYGISCSTLTVDEWGKPVCTNVFLFRNREAVAILTNDVSITIGGDVFVMSGGTATQTVSTGWRIGRSKSLVEINGVGRTATGLHYILVELAEPTFVTTTAPASATVTSGGR